MLLNVYLPSGEINFSKPPVYNSYLKNVYAPPPGKLGQEVLFSSFFGENEGCKLSVYEKTRGLPVRYQNQSKPRRLKRV
jgi:hypothetical protein